MKKTATIILNRNLPDVTDRLYESIYRNNSNKTDIYVVEAGSDENNLSRHCTWWANWDDAMTHGLRVPRGVNYALLQLLNEKKFYKYDYFVMLTNDAEFEEKPVIDTMVEVMDEHPYVGILSPCSKQWGEASLLGHGNTKYFWYVLNVAYMMRREYIEAIMELENPTYLNLLYDGTNFRGYGLEMELVAKGYANDWATAITTKVWVNENEEHLQTKADLIKTETYEENLNLYLDEGRKWMRRKYGFNSRWTMQMYAKFFYDKFFEFYPELIQWKI